MEPFVIYINNTVYQFGLPLPDEIYHFEVNLYFSVQIPTEHAIQLKALLNNVIDRITCDYVAYNGILIPSSELNKF